MKRLSFSIILIFLIIATSDMPQAMVTGQCSNCHTMHNSQGGGPMATDRTSWYPGLLGTPPYQTLLVDTCIGCHSSNTSSTHYNLGGCEVPVVYYRGSGEPTDYLAGGNFWWVANAAQDPDAKGHNVLGIAATDTDLSGGAPGDWVGCANSCHKNLANPLGSNHQDPNNYGTYTESGCTGCHLWPKHHANDHENMEGGLVDSGDKGWYRFLGGHLSGAGCGVKGIEDADWQATKSATDHNEYHGIQAYLTGSGGLSSDIGYTMTAFCNGCHGNFHDENTQSNGTGSWLRHPSDAVILNSGEYRYAFGAGGTGTGIYDPLVPVARPSLSGWTEPSSSVTLGTGGDMVMCLSCHRAHGSPYYKMMRWDYKSTTLSDALYGCSKCHTSKD